MRVLAFVYSFPPFQGGSGMGMYDLLKRLVPKHQITVVTFNYRRGVPSTEILDGIRVYRLSCWRVAHIYPLPRPTISNLSLIWKALRPKPNIIYTRTRFFFTSIMGLFVSFMLKVPMLHTEPGSCYVQTGRRFTDICSRLVDWTVGRMVAKRAICVGVSRASADFMISLGARKVKVIRNGVDRNIFYPGEESVGSDKLRVLYVGRLMWTKGMDILNDVADRLDGKAQITAIGSGPYRLHHKISCPGQLKPQDVAETMRKSDVLVLPSRMEGLSRVIQEAQCCGLPVVATDVGGNRELLDDDTGVLSDVSAESIARSVLLVADAGTRSQMRRKVLQRAEQYDWAETVMRYDRLIRLTARIPALRFRGLLRLLLNPPSAVDTNARAIAKSVIWRIAGIFILGGIAYRITGKWLDTALITLVFHGIRLVLYWLYERCWEHISWGRRIRRAK